MNAVINLLTMHFSGFLSRGGRFREKLRKSEEIIKINEKTKKHKMIVSCRMKSNRKSNKNNDDNNKKIKVR